MTTQSKGNNVAVDTARAPISHWLLVAGTLFAAMLALGPTLVLLWPKWSNGNTYSHGLLILPLVVWFVFRQRHAIAATEQRPSIPAFVILAGLLFGWTWAFAANISVGATALWPLILICAVFAVSGRRAAMCILVPVLLLYSAIPIWDFINAVLQSMTTSAVSVILRAVGVPAFIDGNFVQIPAGLFEIAGGCSGLHFFIVALTLATVYGHVHYGRYTDSFLLLMIAAGISIMMNWIRVATIIIAGHLTDMQSYLVQVDHYTFGWVLFAVMLVPLYRIALRIEPDSVGEASPAEVPRVKGGVRAAPAGIAMVVLVLPVLVWARLVANGPAEVNIQIPDLDGWQTVSAEQLNWRPEFAHPDGQAQARFAKQGKHLDVYANWYETQSQDRELFGHYTSLDGKNARVAYDKPIAGIDLDYDSKPMEIREIMADYQNEERRLIWYHFLIGGESWSRGVKAQLALGLLALTGAEESGAIAVSAVCQEPDCGEARALLVKEFPTINSALTGALLALTHK